MINTIEIQQLIQVVFFLEMLPKTKDLNFFQTKNFGFFSNNNCLITFKIQPIQTKKKKKKKKQRTKKSQN